MRPKEIIALGVPRGKPLEIAIKIIKKVRPKKGEARKILYKISSDPESFLSDQNWDELAKSIAELKASKSNFVLRESPAPYKIWGKENIEPDAIAQLVNACMLPISVAGALMPDGHQGYGLPIGGVLATENTVIPYAVGVDIACRMKLSIFSDPVSILNTKRNKFEEAIEKETRFGVGCHFNPCRRHAVMDEDWSFCDVVKKVKDTAWSQLGTSGSGNHHVDVGILTNSDDPEQKQYLALLTHSGSRGAGGKIAQHFVKIAKDQRQELPKNLLNLAWLDMDSESGQEYWKAMELMGKYASANHELIHGFLVKRLGLHVIRTIENHHNFAWRERHFGKNVIVHRKGATPAGHEVYGVVPGSMATPCYLVKGKGNDLSMHSCSHGAGRSMSRSEAKKKFQWEYVKKFLEKNQVVLISGGIDECPQSYKDIEEVMRNQSDLVSIKAKFLPRLVKMAP
jgi:tRNA-splicing ligase RtcB